MGDELVPTPKAPKNRSIASRLIAKVYQLRMLLFGRSARVLRTLAMESKGMMTIFKWPKHLIVLNFVNSGITINKMAKVFITLIS